MPSRSKKKDGPFKDNIRELRKLKNMTQKEFGETVFKSESAVRMWELGYSEPDIDTLKLIADKFNISIDYLTTSSPASDSQKESQSSSSIVLRGRDGTLIETDLTDSEMEMLKSLLEKVKNIKFHTKQNHS